LSFDYIAKFSKLLVNYLSVMHMIE